VAVASTSTDADAAAARWLATPEAVRVQTGKLFAAAEADGLAHFRLDLDRLPAAADYVAATIRHNYPGLKVPCHARWRQFVIAGRDRWAEFAAGLGPVGPAERARIRFDLVVTSVLLDAGAGPAWRYRDAATGTMLARSEGLAAASLAMFKAGLFSSDPARPLRADAHALARLDAATLATHFQAGRDNPLEGLAGRCALLNRLGEAVAARPDIFGSGRIGHLADHLAGHGEDGALAARHILIAVLAAFGDIWPERARLAGRGLGDTWPHPAAIGPGAASGLVPFHKLSQWLSYSLIEPLVERGVTVIGSAALTGLAEYRNGGLFIDTGVIVPRNLHLLATPQAPGSEPVIEWRALTVALIDRVAPLVRENLGVDDAAMPLAAILEGGTWAAGRRIATETRPGGGPPITIVSDGSLF
jgi:hypothetical protein